MERAPRALPERVHLPSGRVARLSARAARAAAAAVASARPCPRGCLRDLRVLQGAGVLTDERGVPLDPLELPLADAHALRALLAASAVVPEAPAGFCCENCGAPFDATPSRLLEMGPFVDGELDDPELDRAFDFDAWHPIPALRVGRAICRRVKLAPRTAAEALPLLRLAAAARPEASGEGSAEGPELRLTPAVVAAMGVVGLGAERRASALADALAGAPGDAWAAIVDLYHEAHYPARLVAVHRCAECGARNDLDVPLERELLREPRGAPARPRRGGGAAFPDLDAFEAKVRAAAERIYGARGVQNIDLFIDGGVPACDDGGEPLLGCYTPGGEGGELGIDQAPEIRLFYRTFEAERRADPGFDVDAEIEETLDHEVTHHLHHLAGSDPLDEEERDEIERDRVRLVGQAEARRRARRGAVADFGGFLRATWPVWLLVAAASAFAWCGGRTSF